MTTYRYSNTLAYSQVQLAEMHNTSFSGYFFPMNMTPEVSAWFWRVFSIDGRASVVMHDEHGTFVGLTRIGVRGQRGWCGGFGIVPEFRGRGASKALAAQMAQAALENGLTTLQLEVLTQNTRAIKTYEGAGFVATRRLIGIQIETASLPNAAPTLQTQTVPMETLLPRLFEGQQPDWEREPSSILATGAQAIIMPGADGQLDGLIFRRGGGNIQIQAAFIQSDLAQEELAALLRAAAGDATGIQVFNEPEDSPFLARCRELGFNEFFSQHEMFLTL